MTNVISSQRDKVSLLGSTIDYVQHLRGRLKALQDEQLQSTGSTAESPTLDARCCIGSEDDGEASQKIEADVRGKTVLLRVVCREKNGVLIMVLQELEKHGLSITGTNVFPLADQSLLNITVTAQVKYIYIYTRMQYICSYSPPILLPPFEIIRSWRVKAISSLTKIIEKNIKIYDIKLMYYKNITNKESNGTLFI